MSTDLEDKAHQNYIAERDAQVALYDARFGAGNWSWAMWMDQFPVWEALTLAERVEMFGARHD